MADPYRCILVDPSWPERGAGKSKRGADRHYPVMRPIDIYRTIISAECFRPAESSHLWCWVTTNYLEASLALISKLGYQYKRHFVWVKTRDSTVVHGDVGMSVADCAEAELQIGLGQYARGSNELLLFASRGKAALPSPRDRPADTFFAPRGKHSAKPGKSYKIIEQVSPGPRLELFARRARPGWDVWGNEV